jgi:hypothetical protein
LAARRGAADLLADFERAAVELFTSGLTPAEFDRLYSGGTRPLGDYPLYVKGGEVEPEAPTRPGVDEQLTLPG